MIAQKFTKKIIFIHLDSIKWYFYTVSTLITKMIREMKAKSNIRNYARINNPSV